MTIAIHLVLLCGLNVLCSKYIINWILCLKIKSLTICWLGAWKYVLDNIMSTLFLSFNSCKFLSKKFFWFCSFNYPFCACFLLLGYFSFIVVFLSTFLYLFLLLLSILIFCFDIILSFLFFSIYSHLVLFIYGCVLFLLYIFLTFYK